MDKDNMLPRHDTGYQESCTLTPWCMALDSQHRYCLPCSMEAACPAGKRGDTCSLPFPLHWNVGGSTTLATKERLRGS